MRYPIDSGPLIPDAAILAPTEPPEIARLGELEVIDQARVLALAILPRVRDARWEKVILIFVRDVEIRHQAKELHQATSGLRGLPANVLETVVALGSSILAIWDAACVPAQLVVPKEPSGPFAGLKPGIHVTLFPELRGRKWWDARTAVEWTTWTITGFTPSCSLFFQSLDSRFRPLGDDIGPALDAWEAGEVEQYLDSLPPATE